MTNSSDKATAATSRGISTTTKIVAAFFAALFVAIAYPAIDWYATEPTDALAHAEYVGRGTCAECHQTEHADWTGSHHDLAMQEATNETVLGDFENAQFERLGVTTRMFRRDGKYWVNTEGPDGENHDYEVKYTFGVEPLQQYMVELDRGRVQVLRVSWDTSKKRWFYVPPPDAPDLRLEPDDPLHWTGVAQNWNTFCAKCHSTKLEKKYDLPTNTYHTTFAEIDVSCEACHGPASLHVKLAKSNSLFWDRVHGYGLSKIKSVDNSVQIESCARCHSLNSDVCAGFVPGKPLEDFVRPSLLRESMYHADGQIEGEVYVYGSFLQSKMHSKNVRCSDCHNPHSLQLKFEGNALCAQCHEPAKYDTPAHHHHKMDTPGAACVECHMPATTYMEVDPRRDHSIRIPRPDLTVSIGTPNACNACHTKETENATWAAEAVEKWYGPTRRDDPHWGPAFAAGRAGKPDGEKLLLGVVGRPTTPAIVKATAIELLGAYDSFDAQHAIARGLSDASPMVRRASVGSLGASPEALEQLVDKLSDPTRTVRLAAAERLLYSSGAIADPEHKRALAKALEELRDELSLSLDRAGTHLRLSSIEQFEGDLDRAEESLRTAMRLAPYLSEPYTELALLLGQQPGRAGEVAPLLDGAIERLERDVELMPENAGIRFQLGLNHYRKGNVEKAEQRMAEAAELEPENAMFHLYVAELRLKLYSTSGDAAMYDRCLAAIRRYAELAPQDGQAQQLFMQLEQVRAQVDAARPPQDDKE